MTTDDTLDLRGLSPSARGMLRYLADLLGSNYSGKVELECGQGGIREMTKTDRVDLAKEHTRRHA